MKLRTESVGRLSILMLLSLQTYAFRKDFIKTVGQPIWEKDNSDFKKCGERNGETLPRNRDGNAQFPAFFLLYTLYKARTPLEVGDYVMA